MQGVESGTDTLCEVRAEYRLTHAERQSVPCCTGVKVGSWLHHVGSGALGAKGTARCSRMRDCAARATRVGRAVAAAVSVLDVLSDYAVVMEYWNASRARGVSPLFWMASAGILAASALAYAAFFLGVIVSTSPSLAPLQAVVLAGKATEGRALCTRGGLPGAPLSRWRLCAAFCAMVPCGHVLMVLSALGETVPLARADCSSAGARRGGDGRGTPPPSTLAHKPPLRATARPRTASSDSESTPSSLNVGEGVHSYCSEEDLGVTHTGAVSPAGSRALRPPIVHTLSPLHAEPPCPGDALEQPRSAPWWEASSSSSTLGSTASQCAASGSLTTGTALPSTVHDSATGAGTAVDSAAAAAAAAAHRHVAAVAADLATQDALDNAWLARMALNTPHLLQTVFESLPQAAVQLAAFMFVESPTPLATASLAASLVSVLAQAATVSHSISPRVTTAKFLLAVCDVSLLLFGLVSTLRPWPMEPGTLLWTSLPTRAWVNAWAWKVVLLCAASAVAVFLVVYTEVDAAVAPCAVARGPTGRRLPQQHAPDHQHRGGWDPCVRPVQTCVQALGSVLRATVVAVAAVAFAVPALPVAVPLLTLAAEAPKLSLLFLMVNVTACVDCVVPHATLLAACDGTAFQDATAAALHTAWAGNRAGGLVGDSAPQRARLWAGALARGVSAVATAACPPGRMPLGAAYALHTTTAMAGLMGTPVGLQGASGWSGEGAYKGLWDPRSPNGYLRVHKHDGMRPMGRWRGSPATPPRGYAERWGWLRAVRFASSARLPALQRGQAALHAVHCAVAQGECPPFVMPTEARALLIPPADTPAHRAVQWLHRGSLSSPQESWGGRRDGGGWMDGGARVVHWATGEVPPLWGGSGARYTTLRTWCHMLVARWGTLHSPGLAATGALLTVAAAAFSVWAPVQLVASVGWGALNGAQQVLLLCAGAGGVLGVGLLLKHTLGDTAYTAVAHAVPYHWIQDDVACLAAAAAAHAVPGCTPLIAASVARDWCTLATSGDLFSAVAAVSARAAFEAQRAPPHSSKGEAPPCPPALHRGMRALQAAVESQLRGVLEYHGAAAGGGCCLPAPLAPTLESHTVALSVDSAQHAAAAVRGMRGGGEVHVLQVCCPPVPHAAALYHGEWRSALSAPPAEQMNTMEWAGGCAAGEAHWSRLRSDALHQHAATLRVLHVRGSPTWLLQALRDAGQAYVDASAVDPPGPVAGAAPAPLPREARLLPCLREVHLRDMCARDAVDVLVHLAAQGGAPGEPLHALHLHNITMSLTGGSVPPEALTTHLPSTDALHADGTCSAAAGLLLACMQRSASTLHTLHIGQGCVLHAQAAVGVLQRCSSLEHAALNTLSWTDSPSVCPAWAAHAAPPSTLLQTLARHCFRLRALTLWVHGQQAVTPVDAPGVDGCAAPHDPPASPTPPLRGDLQSLEHVTVHVQWQRCLHPSAVGSSFASISSAGAAQWQPSVSEQPYAWPREGTPRCVVASGADVLNLLRGASALRDVQVLSIGGGGPCSHRLLTPEQAEVYSSLCSAAAGAQGGVVRGVRA